MKILVVLLILNAGNQESSLTFPDDAPQWWKDSMKTLDERMEWWEDARFGLFMHWGPYSVLAGEYKDDTYGGRYAEHIGKFSRIPREEYIRKAAGIFRPDQFNADQWVLLAKNAGMRYLVITAKHHDGFATYHSKHSEFDFEDTAKWDRDPLMELKQACDRHGIVFGVYYSHVQDWYEQYNVVNTWDFSHPPKNPSNWHQNPEWRDHLERVETEYVDKKAIPQIKELIEDYGVKVFYFDTPPYFPHELNMKILKAARDAGPDVVINERVTDIDGFGDYRGGPDTPYFYPVYRERYWEGQQTTTNSWGYNKHDEANRKTPEFLLRMLIDTVSKGGNFLLNFSPMGNGAFCEGDLKTFEYFADWARDHGESIHGAHRNPIAFQDWGFITTKDNVLYLHVQADKWPKDGVLKLSGLDNDIQKAALMVGNQPLKFENIGKGLHAIQVPRNPAHPLFTGIKVVCTGELKGDGHRLIDPRTRNRFFGYDTTFFGGRARPTGGKKSDAYITAMGSGSSITWKVRVDKAATYNVQVIYDAMHHEGLGNRPLMLSIGDQSVTGNIIEESQGSEELRSFEMGLNRFREGDYNRFHRKKHHALEKDPKKVYKSEFFVVQELGNITVKPGSFDMTIQAAEDCPKNAALFGFRTVYLTPVE